MTDREAMSPYAEQLLAAVDAAVPGWIEGAMRGRLHAAGLEPDAVLSARLDALAEAIGAVIHTDLGALLALDVDDQRANPLAVLRAAVEPANALLAELGVPAPRRDEFEQRSFPTDTYGLGPATWSDVADSVHEPGIVWGAWKAKTVLDRRRAEGRR